MSDFDSERSEELGSSGAATPDTPHDRRTPITGLSDPESLTHHEPDLMLSHSHAQDLYLILHHVFWVNHFWAKCMQVDVQPPWENPFRALNEHLREMMPLVNTLENELRLFMMFSSSAGKMPPATE